MNYRKSILLYLIITLMITSCGRKTSSDNSAVEEPATVLSDINDTTSITPEDPFRNQPNELCTIIRKLEISAYAPGTTTDDPAAFPKKYCLLDICLETVGSDAITIDLSEEGETVTTTCKVIKVFNSYDAAKSYADQFKIQDVKWEE